MGPVYALWIRQIKRYIRSKARMIGWLGQPILFLVAMGFGFGPTFQKAGEGNYLQFITPGIIAMNLIFSSMFWGLEVIWDRQFGFLKETLVAPVSRLKIMLGRVLGGATVSVMQAIFLLLIAMLLGFRPYNIWMMPLALWFMFLISVMFSSIGTALACLMDDMHAFPIINNLLIMPLFFLSGALFKLEGLPTILTVITRINPLSYGVDGLRGALSGISTFGVIFDMITIMVITTIFLMIGSYLFSKIEA